MFPKGKYPWRIGAPSFIIRAGLEDNVLFLADKVDVVQLLFFESPSKSLLPHTFDVSTLRKIAADSDLSYTVHLPVDIFPGIQDVKQRSREVDEIVSLIGKLSSLAPLSYDLHLPFHGAVSKGHWLENIHEFLVLLKKRLGQESSKVAIENIDYPFAPVRVLALEKGFSICLDIGHALLAQEGAGAVFSDVCQVSHIHYHGVRGGVDHHAPGVEQAPITRQLGRLMHVSRYTGPVTLEIYNRADLFASFAHIQTCWSEYECGWAGKPERGDGQC